jgi:hypothetical protein
LLQKILGSSEGGRFVAVYVCECGPSLYLLISLRFLSFSLVFRERGDVWRFMRSIGQAIEGRVFRKTDAMKVKLLLRVISKTTG